MNFTEKISKSVYEHPICFAALGICPLIVKSTTILSGITISITFSLILILSSASISFIRKLIPHNYRLAFVLVITALWVSIVDMLLQTWLFEMRTNIDFYIPIIAMNSLLIMGLENDAMKSSLISLPGKLLTTSSIVIFICLFTGLLRELLTQGSIMTDIQTVFPTASSVNITVLPDALTIYLIGTVSGAFIILGCVIALINYVYQWS